MDMDSGLRSDSQPVSASMLGLSCEAWMIADLDSSEVRVWHVYGLCWFARGPRHIPIRVFCAGLYPNRGVRFAGLTRTPPSQGLGRRTRIRRCSAPRTHTSRCKSPASRRSARDKPDLYFRQIPSPLGQVMTAHIVLRECSKKPQLLNEVVAISVTLAAM
jgi:hypothetical protein